MFWAGDGVIVQSPSHAQLFFDPGLGDSDLNDADKVAVFPEFTLLYPEFLLFLILRYLMYTE